MVTLQEALTDWRDTMKQSEYVEDTLRQLLAADTHTRCAEEARKLTRLARKMFQSNPTSAFQLMSKLAKTMVDWMEKQDETKDSSDNN